MNNNEDMVYPKVNGRHLGSRPIEELREQLQGKSLEIYYYLVKNEGYHGVREIQKFFGYSSPNVATYHLQKLLDAELVEQNDQNRYGVVSDEIKIGALEDQVRVMSYWVPRSTLMALILFILAWCPIIFFFMNFSPLVYFLIYTPALLVLSIWLFRDGRQLIRHMSRY